jgi:hypothetical protein
MAERVEPAVAHGPCRCLEPASGTPGETIRVGSPAVRIVFNPRRSQLAIGPSRLWTRHRARARSLELVPTPKQLGGASFEVPDVAPGIYLVATFDGSEGGAHYTWDDLRVRAEPEDRFAYDLTFWLSVLGGGALFAAALTVLGRRRL